MQLVDDQYIIHSIPFVCPTSLKKATPSIMTDVDMGGQTSGGEDVNGELVAQAITFARKIARHCSHPRKRPICATCHEKEAVPRNRNRKKRLTKGVSKQSDSTSFKNCITAKQTQLAYNNLKKELAEFAVKELSVSLTDDDQARKDSVEQSILNLLPAIQKIELNRQARNAKREQRQEQHEERTKHASEETHVTFVDPEPQLETDDFEPQQDPLTDDLEPASDMMDDFHHDSIEDGPLSSFIESKHEMADKLKKPPSEPVPTTIKAKLPLRKRTRPTS